MYVLLFLRISAELERHSSKSDLDCRREWDDGCFDGVIEIPIWRGEEINAIQFVYDCNGTLALSEKHGVDGTNLILIM